MPFFLVTFVKWLACLVAIAMSGCLIPIAEAERENAPNFLDDPLHPLEVKAWTEATVRLIDESDGWAYLDEEGILCGFDLDVEAYQAEKYPNGEVSDAWVQCDIWYNENDSQTYGTGNLISHRFASRDLSNHALVSEGVPTEPWGIAVLGFAVIDEDGQRTLRRPLMEVLHPRDTFALLYAPENLVDVPELTLDTRDHICSRDPVTLTFSYIAPIGETVVQVNLAPNTVLETDGNLTGGSLVTWRTTESVGTLNVTIDPDASGSPQNDVTVCGMDLPHWAQTWEGFIQTGQVEGEVDIPTMRVSVLA